MVLFVISICAVHALCDTRNPSTGVSPQKVLEEATRLVHEKYNFFEMTLQIEEFSDGMEDCSQCKMPQT